MKTIEKIIIGAILTLGLGYLIDTGIKDNRDWTYYLTAVGLPVGAASAGIIGEYLLKKDDSDYQSRIQGQ